MANDLIQEFGEALSVQRTAAGSWINGVFVPGGTTTTTPKAVVLPVEPAELVRLDLGERVKAAIDIKIETPLYTASEVNKTAADVVTWQGHQWQVHSVAYRNQIPGLEHYAVTATRVEAT